MFGKAESSAGVAAAAALDSGVALEALVEPPPVEAVDDGAPALVEPPVLGLNVARELARLESAAARNVGHRPADVGGERLWAALVARIVLDAGGAGLSEDADVDVNADGDDMKVAVGEELVAVSVVDQLLRHDIAVLELVGAFGLGLQVVAWLDHLFDDARFVGAFGEN